MTADAAAARPACVGSYRLDLTFGGPEGPSRPYVATIISDRTAIVSPPGAVSTFIPGGADVEFSSALHGAWRPSGRKSCQLVVEQIDAGIDGSISGSSRSTLSIRIDGDQITLDGTAATFDATGAPVASGVPISGRGTRITVDG